MENNNSAPVQQHFTDTKREVENYREQIAAKNVEIAELQQANRRRRSSAAGESSSP